MNDDVAYCKHCDHLYEYGSNLCNSLYQEDVCPICHNSDEVETLYFIDMHIDMLQSMKNCNIVTEKGRVLMQQEIYQLFKIKGKLKEFEEQCHENYRKKLHERMHSP